MPCQFEDFVEKRDYQGALAVLEFQRLAGEGDQQKILGWIGYCSFHLGDHAKAMKTYQELLSMSDADPLDHIYLGCCMFYLGMYSEAEEEILKGPQVPLQTRLLFHLAHKLNDEDKLMKHHGKLKTCVEDQLSLASIHYLRSHFQGLSCPRSNPDALIMCDVQRRQTSTSECCSRRTGTTLH